MRKVILFLVMYFIAIGGIAKTQTLDQEMSGIADKLSKSLIAQGYKNVAALDFTDIQGQPTELGRFLSEELTVEIVSVGRISMVDRANIKSILAEHKLTEAGLVNPENAKKLGEFAGVDAILTGNVTALDDGIILMVKAIATNSAKIAAAGKIKFPKTSEIQQLLNRSVSGNSSFSPAASGANYGSASNLTVNAIATKDIGSLRVVLKSILPLSLNQGAGVRCTFDFINLETQRSIFVAMNAIAPEDKNYIGNFLRSTLVDENGGLWHIRNSDITGMGIVGVGKQSYHGPMYDPTEIVNVLSKRDDLNSDVAIQYERVYALEYRFIFGSTKELLPGQCQTVAMNFIKDQTSGVQARVFQITTEIVVGIAKVGTKKSYSLYNLTFDGVSLLSK